ncbi:CocE/NonD family hydrolase [Streptomyces uncialis]|uniref:Peptidase S15 n=1 Tax=Streptomyces uncialis TaxID=1048205 RepID=A0A1Q4VD06_9ACTN|nr:peptidase S15 [Streptomyces uncialis]
MADTRPHDVTPQSGPRPPVRGPSLSARLMRASWRGLPPKRYDVGLEAGLAVPGADGGTLRADHYFPRADGDFPTLLIRSPYGRGLPWSPMFGILFAEQGFHVVLQSCRGTGGSDGRFDLWRNETADGLAAVTWLRGRPWFTGTLGTVGPSYLGYTQWALALDPPPELKAMVVQVGMHDPHAFYHRGGAFHLENALAVGAGMTNQHRGIVPFLKAVLRLRRGLDGIVSARPLRKAYESALGELPWLDGVMAHPDADDPYWRGAALAGAAEQAGIPTALIGGWHDALVDQTFEQYARLRAAGARTSLLVGPWTHTSALQQGWPEVFAESLAWLRAHLCDDPSGLRPTGVRVHVGGADTWRDLDDWPQSPDPAPAPWYAAPDDSLTSRPPAQPAPLTSFRHDPDAPTPSVGGLLLSRTAGPRDNTALEARDDVRTFTGPPLTEPLDAVGPVSARVRLAVDTGHADAFVRLCDVDGQGRSTNVCDGITRVATAPGTPTEVTVVMSPIAHRFAPGHRVRLQISGGAHPRYASNPGTGVPDTEAATVTPAHITLYTGTSLNLPGGTPAPER